MNLYDDSTPDPWELLVETVLKVEQLEEQQRSLMRAVNQHSGIIQNLLHQNQQLSRQNKELTDYVTRTRK